MLELDFDILATAGKWSLRDRKRWQSTSVDCHLAFAFRHYTSQPKCQSCPTGKITLAKARFPFANATGKFFPTASSSISSSTTSLRYALLAFLSEKLASSAYVRSKA